jgi:hypothetical protein
MKILNPTIFHILDLLVDGSSSFGPLYSAINRFYPLDDTNRHTVGKLWDILLEMEKEELVKTIVLFNNVCLSNMTEIENTTIRNKYDVWLATTSYDEMTVDEIGLRIEILPKGRMEWKKWAKIPKNRNKWLVDFDASKYIIHIVGNNPRTVEKVLKNILSGNPKIKIIPSSRNISKIMGYQLGDGTFVAGGVKLSICYSDGTENKENSLFAGDKNIA